MTFKGPLAVDGKQIYSIKVQDLYQQAKRNSRNC